MFARFAFVIFCCVLMTAMARLPQGVPPLAYKGYLVNDGDSFSNTHGSTDGASIMTYVSVPNRNLAMATTAVTGQTLSGNISTFPATVLPIYSAASKIYGTSLPFIVQILSGANDIRSSVAVSTIYANLQTYVNLVHALGANAKVVVGSQPVQCDIFNSSPELTALQTYNGDIRSNWNVAQSSGGLGADGLSDFWANSTIGQGNYTGSAFCGFPNTYSSDGQHPTDAAMAILGPIEETAVQPLIP